MNGISEYDLDDIMVEATRADGKPRLRIYPYDRVAVVLGRGSDAEAEVHLDAARAHGVPVLRRSGGGCSVVLDPGNVIVSLALPASGFGRNNAYFDAITQWLIQGLARIGIHGVVRDGVSDLVLGRRKVSGSCIRRFKDCLYFSATLLVRPDIDAVGRYLKHPPREPQHREGRDHSEFMGSLEGFPVSSDIRSFVKSLSEVLRVEDIRLP